MMTIKVIPKPKTISLEFSRKKLECFCAAMGLFTREFLHSLDKSAAEHCEGRTKEVKNLMEIVK